MRCLKCIHYDLCKAKKILIPDTVRCKFFKDKALIPNINCKVGDKAYCLRWYHSTRKVQEGIISELKTTEEGKIFAVVKFIGRGIVGEGVFLTRKEAEEALKEKHNG